MSLSKHTTLIRLTCGVEYWLVFAHEHQSDPFRKLAQNAVRGIDMVPYTSVR